MVKNKTLDDVFAQVDKLSDLLGGVIQHTSRIPIIEKVANEAHQGVIVLREKIENNGEDISRVEEQIKETWLRQQTDIEEGIKTRAMAQQACDDLTDYKDSKRTMLRTLIGIMISIIMALFGSVFFIGNSLGSLNTKVDEQSKIQAASTKRLESQLDTMRDKTTQSRAHTMHVNAEAGQ
jgi:hypothetical protein